MYRCLHFKLEELIPRDIIPAYGDGAWGLMTDAIKQTADNIREFFGHPMHINIYPMKKYRGYRTPSCPEWVAGSQHSIGNAIDFNIDGLGCDYIRNQIVTQPNNPAFALIGGVEDFLGMSWVHVDCRPRVNGRIFIFGR